MILISACLVGKSCKYNGGNNLVPEIKELYEKEQAILVCPEQLGGLSTPRIPAEIQNDKVINQEGQDVTEEYVLGAKKALEICKQHHCTKAVLKAYSPSCSPCGIYDGTFTHTKIDGKGVFARLLEENGVEAVSEIEYVIQKAE